MHWILQTNLFNEKEWDTLVGILERFNLPHSVHKVIPFIGELVPPAEPQHEKVICLGAYSMRHTAKVNRWNPGVYDLFDVNFLVQREHWGVSMLNYDSRVMPFRDAVLTEPTFIRPIDDSKHFAGKVFEPEEWNSWRKGIVDAGYDYGNALTPETLVQLCSPKKIYAEYRYWIVDTKIVTRSLYKRGDKVMYSADVDYEVDNFVNCIMHGVHHAIHPWLPKAFVFDVALTPEGFKIVEINTINSAGFYAGDMLKIVMALEEIEA